MNKFDELSKVIGCAIEVHRNLRPGLLESAYLYSASHGNFLLQIFLSNLKFLPVEYKGVHLDCGYRLDVLVENKLIVEVKAVEK